MADLWMKRVHWENGRSYVKIRNWKARCSDWTPSMQGQSKSEGVKREESMLCVQILFWKTSNTTIPLKKNKKTNVAHMSANKMNTLMDNSKTLHQTHTGWHANYNWLQMERITRIYDYTLDYNLCCAGKSANKKYVVWRYNYRPKENTVRQ